MHALGKSVLKASTMGKQVLPPRRDLRQRQW